MTKTLLLGTVAILGLSVAGNAHAETLETELGTDADVTADSVLTGETSVNVISTTEVEADADPEAEADIEAEVDAETDAVDHAEDAIDEAHAEGEEKAEELENTASERIQELGSEAEAGVDASATTKVDVQ